mgnify:CR=1 FL=1
MSEAEEEVSISAQTDKGEYTVGEKVRASIVFQNIGSNPIKLNFNSAQRYEFILLKEDEEVWRWSRNKMFAMVLESLVLKPKEKRIYTEALETAGMPPGSYDLVGIITSRPPRKATCRFTIRPSQPIEATKKI